MPEEEKGDAMDGMNASGGVSVGKHQGGQPGKA